ncbi:MAG: carbohydrate binding domain-containing protein [Sedimentisphaerales bacterium]|nr:carbohydrate binding domain-containing protein [Sedimentisphaerales bacterium]
MTVKYLSLLLVLAVVVSLAPAYGETNLVENPGFENGTTGWAGRTCKIEAVTTPVHDGAGAAKAFGRIESWQGIKQSMLNKMASGSTYKISGWVRLENSDTDTVTLSVEQTDENGTKYINVESGSASNTEWLELSGEFMLDAGGTLKVLDIYFEGPEGNINFFVDDVSVEVVVPASAPVDPNAPKADPNAPKEEPKTGACETKNQN